MLFTVAVSAVCWLCGPASAQTGVRALPALWLAPRLEAARDELRVAIGGGYGLTERVIEPGGLHHRLQGGLALSASSKHGLGAELRVDGRWDLHDVPGRDDSMVGEPRLFLRFARDVARRWRLGSELGLLVPGRGAPSLSWSATTLEGLLVAHWQSSSRSSLTLASGARYDRGARTVDPGIELSASDRISLGVNSHHALLTRVAWMMSTRAGRVGLELSSDLLLGVDAPVAAESPLRAALVLGRALPTRRSTELVVVASSLLTRRPALSDTLQRAFEPRVWLSIGLIWGLRAPSPGAAAATPVATSTAPAAAIVLPDEGELDVWVIDDLGQPLTDAHVTLAELADRWTTADGKAPFLDLAPALYTVRVEAAGHPSQQVAATVRAGETTTLRVVLQRTLERTALRLQVRDAISAQPVAANIAIQRIARAGRADRERTDTDAAGTLELELEPGSYRITLRAPRYRSQTRTVRLAPGVSVYLVDLVPLR